MEHNGGNKNLPLSSLCRSGCGFYGNDSFEGMCSKCYKDALKRKQQNPSPSPVGGRSSPTVSSHVDTSVISTLTSSASTAGASTSISTIPSVETGVPTVPTPFSPSHKNVDAKPDSEEGAVGGADTSTCSDTDSQMSDKDKKPKKNRCHTCKKKIGLTGFPCRCGGLFCSLHRYSDKHDCTFNYKELGQEQIRKQNPVIVGSKIQKI